MDDMFQSEEESRVALYARRVLIQRNCSRCRPQPQRQAHGMLWR
jgi:HSP90 family molecular chaperone